LPLLEKIIHLGNVEPLDIYGENNSKIELIRAYSPKVKIIARGSVVKIQGPQEEILHFEFQLERLLQFYHRFNRLTEKDIRSVFDTPQNVDPRPADSAVIVYGNGGVPIKAITKNQQKIVEAVKVNDMVFAVGPAGTGKTYTAVALALRALKNKEVKRIILTRPAVEAGENLGFLPGDLKEKLDPYLQPLFDGLRDMIPHEKLAEYLETETIQIAPLAFMRGRTLDKAFVILDEAQNATKSQLKMFLTRMGKSAKFVITGDQTQVDLPRNQSSGLSQTIKLVEDIKGIEVVHLDGSDVVRHPLVEKIIQAFDNNDEGNNK
jgi:phosphate starvation-inducible PhoH-like protein